MLKPTTTQEPISSRARHTMQILQQRRNSALSIKIHAAQRHTKHRPISKLTTGHSIALQREEIQLHAPEHLRISLTRKLWQVNHPTPPTGSRLHNKEEPWASSLQKQHPKHSNVKRMKRQRNTQQIKEYEKCPPSQTKEEIGNLPEKEFRIMITKWSKVLKTKWSYK